VSKPVKIYQDCAVCDTGKSARIFFQGAWWRTSTVLDRRDTPQGLPRFETMNTIYSPDLHDGGDPLNTDYKDTREKVNLDNPFAARYLNDEFISAYGADCDTPGC
jgi:hypothetical protein